MRDARIGDHTKTCKQSFEAGGGRSTREDNMPRRTYRLGGSPPTDPRDEEIKSLKRELSEVRWDLISLQPSDTRDLLTSYHGCTTRAEWQKWKSDTTEAVIELAEVDPTLSSALSSGKRAVCPLCGDGATAFGAGGGFAYPGGLERHLT